MTLAWAFCALWLPVIAVLMLVTLGRRKDTLGAALMRIWGSGMLWIAGVRLQVDPEVRAELALRRARVMPFNHGSTLDLFIGAALMPAGGVTIVKRELMFVPLIGQVVLLLDIVMLDRRNRDRAAASLKAAGDRLRREKLSVFIAPEGTRAAGGQVGPFKLGAFHLAVEARVPIVPMVWHGAGRLLPLGAWHCRSGTVRISLLREMTMHLSGDERQPTEASQHTQKPNDVHAMAATLRAAYQAALAAG